MCVLSHLTLKCNLGGKRGPFFEYLLLLNRTYISHYLHQLKISLPLHLTNLIAICEAPFLELDLSIMNDIVSSKIYDKRDDFNFEIVNFPFLDEDIPHSPSYGVYISQLIRFCASIL